MTILILTCDLCGADAGDDPYHATMNGNGHVHICKARAALGREEGK